ncbi:hypothetical protein MKEN_00720800 [Mycena kentingensis (nom. inval.)]|nr:hypothetical protein MKEN_00720800 [Mycena kentingensis (nom. inval.)]
MALAPQLPQPTPSSRRVELPIELWDIIFELSGPDAATLSLVHSPLNVSQVSRRWRAIGLSNTALWSTLAVTTTRRHAEDALAFDALYRVVRLWLRRSGTRLLCVSLTHSDNVETARPLDALLESVLRHSCRLRALRVDGPGSALFPLEHPGLCFPALEDLKIDTTSSQHPGAAPEVTVALNYPPRLRSLVAHASSVQIAAVDCRQLTALDVLGTFWTVEETLVFLADAPHMQNLRLSVNGATPNQHPRVEAPSLRSLTLEFDESLSPASLRCSRIGVFFALLHTPNLDHLSIHERPVTALPLNSWPHSQFVSFLGRTPLLRSLHLAHLPLYETQIVECLQQIPLLVDLVLEAQSQRNVGDLLVNALACGIAAALRSVEFRHCGKRCTEQALIHMVDSRVASGELRYLRVHRSALPSPELVKRVEEWEVVVDVQY